MRSVMHMLLCAFILSHFMRTFCVADVPGSGKGKSLHWQDGEEPYRLSRWVRGISSTFLWNTTLHPYHQDEPTDLAMYSAMKSMRLACSLPRFPTHVGSKVQRAYMQDLGAPKPWQILRWRSCRTPSSPA